MTELRECPICFGNSGKRMSGGTVRCMDEDCKFKVAILEEVWQSRAPDKRLLKAIIEIENRTHFNDWGGECAKAERDIIVGIIEKHIQEVINDKR